LAEDRNPWSSVLPFDLCADRKPFLDLVLWEGHPTAQIAIKPPCNPSPLRMTANQDPMYLSRLPETPWWNLVLAQLIRPKYFYNFLPVSVQ
jgi:hypothetical protein